MALRTAINRSHLLHLLAIVSVVSLSSCTDDNGRAPTPSDTVRSVEQSDIIKRDTGPPTDRPETVEESVYREYARLAVALPRREADSILRSTPPTEIEEQMTRRMNRQDTIARSKLAAKYNLSRDSVDAILTARKVPKR